MCIVIPSSLSYVSTVVDDVFEEWSTTASMSSSLTPLLDLLLPAMFGGSQPPRTEVELPLAGLKEDDRDEDWAPLAPHLQKRPVSVGGHCRDIDEW
jgi:hypothetical protein